MSLKSISLCSSHHDQMFPYVRSGGGGRAEGLRATGRCRQRVGQKKADVRNALRRDGRERTQRAARAAGGWTRGRHQGAAKGSSLPPLMPTPRKPPPTDAAAAAALAAAQARSHSNIFFALFFRPPPLYIYIYTYTYIYMYIYISTHLCGLACGVGCPTPDFRQSRVGSRVGCRN